jgi:hypothetical protein
MMFLYLLALLPVTIGAVLWIFHKKVVWWEWLIGCAIAFITSGIFHFAVVYGMTADSETWSGQVHSAHHEPYWYAEWQELETYTVTVGSGSNARTETRTRWVTRSETHHPEWWVQTSVGRISIGEGKYAELRSRFGQEVSTPGHRPNFQRGDRNDYRLVNVNSWAEPVNVWRTWENRLQAAPSTFTFPDVPEGTPVFEYPENGNPFRSDRLLGRANAIDLLEFDRMNGRLGPSMKVNVIIIGFPSDAPQSLAQHQEAHWFGGEKNDLVLCYGGGQGTTASWSYVFGWTEEELVKRNLETILLNNPIDTSILPLLEQEIRENYEIRDWSQFDYISIEPPTWSYFVLLLTMAITQTGFWLWAHFNNLDKDNAGLESFGKKRNKRTYINPFRKY